MLSKISLLSLIIDASFLMNIHYAFELNRLRSVARPYASHHLSATSPEEETFIHEGTGISIISVSGSDRLRFLQSLGSNDFSNSTVNDIVKCGFLDSEARVIDAATCLIMQDTVKVVLDHNSSALENYFRKNIFPVDNVVVDSIYGMSILRLFSRNAEHVEANNSSKSSNVSKSHHIIEKVVSTSFSSIQKNRFLFDKATSSIVFREYDFPLDTMSVIPLEHGTKKQLLSTIENFGVRKVTDDDFEMLRVHSGRPTYGREYGLVSRATGKLQCTALEVGMMEMLHFRKGCYVGNEAVSRTVSTNSIRRKLCGIEIPDAKEFEVVLRALTMSASESLELLDDDGEVAVQITSALPRNSDRSGIVYYVSYLSCSNRCLGFVRSKYAAAETSLVLTLSPEVDVAAKVSIDVFNLWYPKFSPEDSPAPPVPKSPKAVVISTESDATTEEERRKQEKLKKMKENLAKFKQQQISASSLSLNEIRPPT